MLVNPLAPIQGNLLSLGALSLMSITLSILLVYGFILYPLLHGRLRHVPGPWLAKISRVPLSFYDILCYRNDKVLQWHRQYGPVVLIAPNQVSVATLEATRDVYKATHRWAKSDYFDHFKGWDERSVFATKPYEDHRKKRKGTSVFYQASTIYKLPEIEQNIRKHCLAVLKQVDTGQESDVFSLASWYALDNITFLAFGPNHDTHAVEQGCRERHLLEDLKHQQFVGPFRVQFPGVYASISQILGRLSPRFNYLLADKRFADWCEERFHTALKDPTVFQSHSLIRHLSETDGGCADKESMDSRYVAAEVLDNINAAEATVAVTAAYLIWRLTEAPLWQRKIRQELSAIRLQDDGSLAFADIDSQAPSLHACLQEVYRLHPASSGRSERVVPPGGHTLSGVYLPEDTIVASSVVALHQDESVYPDPERFAPERWLEEDEQLRQVRDAQLMPFGYGGRICLGKALATMELKMLIAGLYLEHESVGTAATTAASMKQCSTHDAVPKALKCVVQFRRINN